MTKKTAGPSTWRVLTERVQFGSGSGSGAEREEKIAGLVRFRVVLYPAPKTRTQNIYIIIFLIIIYIKLLLIKCKELASQGLILHSSLSRAALDHSPLTTPSHSLALSSLSVTLRRRSPLAGHLSQHSHLIKTVFGWNMSICTDFLFQSFLNSESLLVYLDEEF